MTKKMDTREEKERAEKEELELMTSKGYYWDYKTLSWRKKLKLWQIIWSIVGIALAVGFCLLVLGVIPKK